MTKRTQKSKEREETPPRILFTDCVTNAYRKFRTMLGNIAKSVSAGLKKLKGASPNSPNALL
jgi:hypothetical protein